MKLIEKWRVKGSYRCMKTKKLEKIWGKITKILTLNLDRLKREREKLFEKIEIVMNTWKAYVFKKLSKQFWLIEKKIWSIENYIWLIQQWSSIDRSKQIQTKILLTISIDRATSSINRKSRKIKLKNKAIYAETPQSMVFYE